MTGDGMCGVFIPDRVLAGWWRSQWKASDRMWAGRCTTGCRRGQVYKYKSRWDHCSVPGGCLLSLSLCSSGFPGSAEVETPISVDNNINRFQHLVRKNFGATSCVALTDVTRYVCAQRIRSYVERDADKGIC